MLNHAKRGLSVYIVIDGSEKKYRNIKLLLDSGEFRLQFTNVCVAGGNSCLICEYYYLKTILVQFFKLWLYLREKELPVTCVLSKCLSRLSFNQRLVHVKTCHFELFLLSPLAKLHFQQALGLIYSWRGVFCFFPR